ncbi:hypothetical protein GCM10010532_060980 [Dactylosporangium siamense]|uniref:Uncharacterized protein n=1 Tax=Dactylosporangium siamense TaxID=685454 RepID=A0A919UGW3_9ACTN|nr:hypothetical protein Dsi01nite_081390 [Dactylosporangium siamense]
MVEKNGYVSRTSGERGSPGTLPGSGPLTVAPATGVLAGSAAPLTVTPATGVVAGSAAPVTVARAAGVLAGSAAPAGPAAASRPRTVVTATARRADA